MKSIKCMDVAFGKTEFSEKMKNISRDIEACDYQISELSENTAKLKPNPTEGWYHNSFLPSVTMEMQNEASPQKLIVTFELTKQIKRVIGVLQWICLIFQIFLLIGFVTEDWGVYSLFPVCLPALLILFLYLLSYLGLKYSSNRFFKNLKNFLR